MRAKAVYTSGYEHHEGELELSANELVFSKKKDRKGTFAAFGLIGLALSKGYEPLLTVPRADIHGASPTDNDGGFDIETPRGTYSFSVKDRSLWLIALDR